MNNATSSADQQFLDDLDKKLWNAADRLRSNLDAAVYKHAVLGLIFLKYVSDAFDLRREELEASFRDPQSDYFLDRADYKSDAAYAKALHGELEDRDYFTEKNVFWVPPLARWQTIRENAALAPDTEIEIRNGKTERYTFRSAARLIDDALEAVEKENPRLKGIIEKNRYMQLQIPACVWFLTKNKSARRLNSPASTSTQHRDRKGEVLFIDARQLGFMKDRVLRDFTAADLEKISGTFRAWRRDPSSLNPKLSTSTQTAYANVPGFCYSATLDEIAKHGFVLTPGRFVGAEDVADDGEPFDEKMQKLATELNGQFAESAKLEQAIKANLQGIGYGE